MSERGRERLLGPMDFTTNDECGLLIEGYDVHPMILEPWHPPYYRERLEARGYGKTIDLLIWWLSLGELKQGDRFAEAIHEVADKVESEHGITVRNMRKRDLEAEIAALHGGLQRGLGEELGLRPDHRRGDRLPGEEPEAILDERWTFIAERDGEVLGAALTLPDINQVTKRMNGRLLPIGWIKFLFGRRTIDRVRVFALGVKPEYQHTGIAARFYVRHIETAAETGSPAGDQGWILETNEPMNRAMEGMGGKIVKRYRLYEKPLGSPNSGRSKVPISSASASTCPSIASSSCSRAAPASRSSSVSRA